MNHEFYPAPEDGGPEYSGARPDERDPQPVDADMVQGTLDAIEDVQVGHMQIQAFNEQDDAIAAHRELLRAHEQGETVSEAELTAATKRVSDAREKVLKIKPHMR